MAKIDTTTNHLSNYENLNYFNSIETISIKDPYYVAPPSVEKIVEVLKKNIEESLKLVKSLQELGCGGYYTEDSLCEVLNDIENLEVYGTTDKQEEK